MSSLNLARVQSMITSAEQMTAGTLIGFRITEANVGMATCTLVTDPTRHANPMGTIHGGILCDIADAAMGFAFVTTLEEHESFTTLELKINYLRPVWKATLRARGKVAKRGKTVGLVECEVLDESDALVAKAMSTCMVLRGEQRAGR